MKGNRKIGYIVLDKDGSPMWAKDRSGRQKDRGVLYLGRGVTLFPTLAAARSAIGLTNRYAIVEGLSWDRWGHQILRVYGGSLPVVGDRDQ